jgi:hypothetical protein
VTWQREPDEGGEASSLDEDGLPAEPVRQLAGPAQPRPGVLAALPELAAEPLEPPPGSLEPLPDPHGLTAVPLEPRPDRLEPEPDPLGPTADRLEPLPLPDRLEPAPDPLGSAAGSLEPLPDAAPLIPGVPDDPGYRPSARRRGWTAMIVLLVVALCGLAVGAAGVARQVLPRQFSAAQQQQIATWQMSRRWRAMPAGQIFPASVSYAVPPQALDASQSLTLTATRLGIGPQSGCAAEVSAAAAAVLAAGHCMALLRATYVDASGSMVITLGIAVLPDKAAASAAALKLPATGFGQRFAVHALPVAGTPAARFHDAERELSIAVSAGPYVVLATAGFTDSRQHVVLRTDSYYNQEMTSLAGGLADSAANRLGTQPVVPRCPGAPGC